MKRFTLAVCTSVLLLLGGQSHAQDLPSKQTDLSVFGWFGELTGACWRAEFPDGQSRDRQCYTTQFGKVIRVDQVVESLKQGTVTGTLTASSIYAWDPRRGRLRHVFWADDGSLESSSGWIEGTSLILHLDHEVDTAGNVEVRTVLRRDGPDAFTASRERKQPDGWKSIFQIRYRRDT